MDDSQSMTVNEGSNMSKNQLAQRNEILYKEIISALNKMNFY